MNKLHNSHIVHPKLTKKASIKMLTETISNYFKRNFSLFPVITSTEGYIKVEFSKALEISSETKLDYISNSLSKLLYSDYGLVTRVSKNENSYNIYLEEHLIKDEVEADANIILDNRFIWLFDLLDKHSEVILENIGNLEEAIELAVADNNIKIIVANPYIDPDPKNKDVELVFADNPGPVIIYDGVKPEPIKDGDVSEEDLQQEAINNTKMIDPIFEESINETTQITDIGVKLTYLTIDKDKKKKSKKDNKNEAINEQITQDVDVANKVDKNMGEAEIYKYIKQLVKVYKGETTIQPEFAQITEILVRSLKVEDTLKVFVKLMKQLQPKIVPDTSYKALANGKGSQAEQAQVLFDRITATGILFKNLAIYFIAQLDEQSTNDSGDELTLDSIAKEAEIQI